MSLKVQYLRGVRAQGAECWSFVSLADDVKEAVSEAKEVQASAQEYWGAKSYRIVDEAGHVLSSGKIDGFSGVPSGEL